MYGGSLGTLLAASPESSLKDLAVLKEMLKEEKPPKK